MFDILTDVLGGAGGIVPPVEKDNILLEDGSNLLLEDGGLILLEG